MFLAACCAFSALLWTRKGHCFALVCGLQGTQFFNILLQFLVWLQPSNGKIRCYKQIRNFCVIRTHSRNATPSPYNRQHVTDHTSTWTTARFSVAALLWTNDNWPGWSKLEQNAITNIGSEYGNMGVALLNEANNICHAGIFTLRWGRLTMLAWLISISQMTALQKERKLYLSDCSPSHTARRRFKSGLWQIVGSPEPDPCGGLCTCRAPCKNYYRETWRYSVCECCRFSAPYAAWRIVHRFV